jgi:hypothetical protein
MAHGGLRDREGCTQPTRLIEAIPHANRTFVNEYVPDKVAAAALAHAAWCYFRITGPLAAASCTWR